MRKLKIVRELTYEGDEKWVRTVFERNAIQDKLVTGSGSITSKVISEEVIEELENDH